MKRRQILHFIALSAGTPLFSQCQRLGKPQVVSRQNGLLEVSLTAQRQTQRVAGQQSHMLTHGIDSGPSGFIINDRSFEMGRVDTAVKLNQVEDWQIINQASIDHPFHLHTNRFQVLKRNGRPESLLSWKDTVSLKGYETVTIRVRFEDFVGRTVYHCHILDHEDQGMMGIIEIS